MSTRRLLPPLCGALIGLSLLASCSREPEPRSVTTQPAPGSAPTPASEAASGASEASPKREAIAPLTLSPQRVRGVVAPMPTASDLHSATATTEHYANLPENPLQRTAEQPLSTFSIDVDTGAYANVRRFLRDGQLPPAEAVRVEELINYFDYADAAPRSRDTPFALHSEVATTPWNPDTVLLRVALKAWESAAPSRPANLVFLVDVSGSMHSPDKLPLAQQSLRLLSRQLGADDRISLVSYAGHSGVVLEPTPGTQQQKILDAIDRLQAGGGTNGASGIETAYRLAEQARIDGGINRVILATDGDFNVGVTNFDALLDIARRGRAKGLALTTLGFGQGNYNDALMEQLADAGDGNHAYIDNLAEAQKVLVRQRGGTLDTVARDVKIQIEFNPRNVTEYRLIGYENRMLRREDFNNDAVDAGDIGAGHSVTALYELRLSGSRDQRLDPLRYGAAASNAAPAAAHDDELAYLRLRYKRPGFDASEHVETRLPRSAVQSLTASSAAFRLSAAVAAYGQKLRHSSELQGYSWDEIHALAAAARGADAYGDEGELLKLIQSAASLSQANGAEG